MEKILLIIVFVSLPPAAVHCAVDYSESDFATEIVDYPGGFGTYPYDDPNAVLGKPAVRCKNSPYEINVNNAPEDFRVKITEPALNVNLDDEKVLVTINPGEYIVVKFDHKVYDYPGNPYGQDFIVFGNSFFTDVMDVNCTDQSNMNQWYLSGSGGGNFEEVRVSVSQDGQSWCTFDSPYADGLFPTQAYKWDRQNACWTDEEMDWLKPVDPDLTASDFAGKSAADAIELYDGSAGGTPFDISSLDANCPNYPETDPQTGYRWIQYIRFEVDEGMMGGEIDAVSDIAACGDPGHPRPVGDLNGDCRVNNTDLALLVENWLKCTFDCN